MLNPIQPHTTGYVTRDGVKVYYEVFGQGDITVMLHPSWSIAHSLVWRLTAPYLSRFYRVIRWDGRGNGKSDRPAGPEHYHEEEFVKDAVAILDATQTEKCVSVSFSGGGRWNLLLTAEHPERVLGCAFYSPAIPLAEETSDRKSSPFVEKLDSTEGWAKFNKFFWTSSRENFENFAQWFNEQVQSHPHSTLPIELQTDWALETDGQTLVYTVAGWKMTRDRALELCKKVTCPVFVLHGEEDKIRNVQQGITLAEATQAELVLAETGAHGVAFRYPIWSNNLLHDFIERKCTGHLPRKLTVKKWKPSMKQPKRVLIVCSPIGLGHARRDLAVVNELRKLRPDVKIEWLTKTPVDKVILPLGEVIHPASQQLIDEIQWVEQQAGDHFFPNFPVFRNLDAVNTYNFHVYQEMMEREHFDLVVADQGWDIDFFYFEHPELKRAPYVWATDLIGWLPTLEDDDEPFDPLRPRIKGRAYEQYLVKDYNEEMISRMERFPNVRDMSLYFGEEEDIPDESFGEGLPRFRDWIPKWFDFGGYVLGYDPAQHANKAELRRELGYGPNEKVVICAVGGTNTGANLLRKCIEAFPEAKRKIPELRMIVVAGPRIDLKELPQPAPGCEVKGYVESLYRHMAACDLGIVHGGLTQNMDLVANNVSAITIPLVRHYEQDVFVRHRLKNYGAGHYLDYRKLRGPDGPKIIGEAMVEELTRTRAPFKKVTDHAERFAKKLTSLL